MKCFLDEIDDLPDYVCELVNSSVGELRSMLGNEHNLTCDVSILRKSQLIGLLVSDKLESLELNNDNN